MIAHRYVGIVTRGLLLGLVLVTRPAAAQVTVDSCAWMPDRGAPCQWFENSREIRLAVGADYRAPGYLVIVMRNGGAQPASPTRLLLDGRPLDEWQEEQKVVWWRVLPGPIPAGALGELRIRLREPLAKPAVVVAGFGEDSVRAVVRPEPPPLRVETVGFNPAMNRVFLVAERVAGTAPPLVGVELDGRDVTKRCRLLDPGFATGISPVELSLERPLRPGSYHVYTLVARGGIRSACCVRTYDGWVPLGAYGYAEYEEFDRNGCNGHASFGRHTKADLDSHATLRMRAVSQVGDQAPPAYMIGHSGLFAYYLHDEPDVWDYSVESLPHPQRIGSHAPEMERRRRLCAQADPTRLTLLTMDLTYKPANYFIYGTIADVLNTDCYPISLGADARMVREVVETARRAAAGRPLTFTFQGCFEEPDDPKERAARRFPRPPFAEEERLMMYYAIGAGARGLFDYIHCSEKAATWMSHGSKEHPDVWAEIGRVYRELGAVAPYLALAHPTALARADRPGVSVSTLVCGADALLLACVNEEYTQEARAFRCRPARDVVLRLPRLPWLRPAGAWWITEEGARPLSLASGAAGATVRVPEILVAGMVLVSADARAGKAVNAACARRRQTLGAALLAEWRDRQRAEATFAHEVRRITGQYGAYAAAGTGIGAYGIQEARYWNPNGDPQWVFEFGENEAKESEKGVEWRVSIPEARAGKPHTLYAVVGTWGPAGVLTVLSPGGQEVARQEVAGGWSGTLISLKLRPAQAGEYVVRFLQGGKGPKGGRVARVIYVVPS